MKNTQKKHKTSIDSKEKIILQQLIKILFF